MAPSCVPVGVCIYIYIKEKGHNAEIWVTISWFILLFKSEVATSEAKTKYKQQYIGIKCMKTTKQPAEKGNKNLIQANVPAIVILSKVQI